MTAPADALATIPDSQLALFLPNQKLVDDYKTNQSVVAENADSLIQVEQDATDALAGANAALTRLNGTPFILLGVVPPAGLSQSRSLVVSSDLTLADAGAAANLTLGLNQRTVILGANAVDNTGLFVVAPGMQAPVAANSTYLIEGLLTFQSAALTTGIGLAWLLPGAATICGGYSHPGATPTALQTAYNIASGTVSANTAAVPVAGQNTPITCRWIVKTTVAGTIVLDFRSGTAAVFVTLLQDLSMLSFRKIA